MLRLALLLLLPLTAAKAPTTTAAARRKATTTKPTTTTTLTTTVTTTTSTEGPHYQVINSKTCVGEETRYDSCPNLKPCPATCNPQDCKFADWSEWAPPLGGCTGVDSRQRGYKQQNNECGKPCNGTLAETKESNRPDSCERPKQDCKLGEWEAWSKCGSSKLEQIERVRKVENAALNGGQPCGDAIMRQTKPCGEPPAAKNCELDEWSPWTKCDSSCGWGMKKRDRKIAKASENEGETCKGVTTQQEVCFAGTCQEKTDCSVSEWGEWSDCSKWYQQTRTKKVTQAAAGGNPCKGTNINLKEQRKCDFTPPVDCEMSEWQPWEACDKTCDGGQKLRARNVTSPPRHGGNCTGGISETAACGDTRCFSKGERDCKLQEWAEWGACSAPCGKGVKRRSVKGLVKMKNGGRACKNVTAEIGHCKIKDCEKEDCAWNDWVKWEPCSVSCGGGFKRRQRTLKTSPRFGGAACEAKMMSEVAPCSKGSCLPDCKNGTWDDWSKWSDCSAKCGSGYQSRTRVPETSHLPNYCGWPAIGSKQEYKPCTGTDGPKCNPPKDCELTKWASWGSCSATCFGVRERSRMIKQYATEDGKGCEDVALKAVRPCNPGTGEKADSACGTKSPKRDCKLSDWASWGGCSAKCNGGQKMRTRNILSPPQNFGTDCETRLQESTSCGMEPCQKNCVDCKISEWMEWGACSQASQRVRTREVTTLPNYCGRACSSEVISETKACVFASKEYRFCSWGEWSSFSSCPSTCTQSRKRRSRTLGTKLKADKADYLFSFLAERQTACFGTQFDSAACNMTKCKPLCTPVDCHLSDWSKWSVPMGFGLCRRTRSVSKPNNDCGKPCVSNKTSMAETKSCPLGLDPIDCKISVWSDWSVCENPEALRLRMRHIERDPSNGGKDCLGALKDMESCYQTLKPVPCSFTEWSKWDACNTQGSAFKGKNGATCGDGYTQRTRRIKETSKAGGAPCSAMLSEVKVCQGAPCRWDKTTDCVWAKWSKWSSECKANFERYRVRSFTPANNNGNACTGSGYEIKGCAPAVKDCVLSGWTAWGKCSSDCRGIRSRSRFLTEQKNFGKVCAPSQLKETEHCNTHVTCPNDQDCVLGAWGHWKECSVTCGFAGQEFRTRAVKTSRRVDGIGCTDKTTETRGCKDLPRCNYTDCAWNSWQKWTECSKTCGVGQTDRTRNLKQATIGPGAKPCAVQHMKETAQCKKVDCKAADCVDGQWHAWGKWEACSATCGAGVTWRRRVIKTEANYCGKQVAGASQHVASCSSDDECPKDVDCDFGDWNSWTDCSRTCDGTKSRVRSIKTRAAGNGKACGGAKKETGTCNPSKDASGCPVSGLSVDCKLSTWSLWAKCAVTCGVSQRERSRTVEIDSLHGGKVCDPALTQTGPCDIKQCDRDMKMQKKSCEWHSWSEWGACDKCGGLMYRYRQVKVHAQYGGANCTGEASQDMKTCDRSCFDKVHCAWTSWAEWSDCDVKCKMEECTGHNCGRRTRKRQLQVTKQSATRLFEDHQAAAEVEGQVQELYRRAQTADSRRWQEVSAAFVLGCFCFLVGFGVLSRVERSPRQTREVQSIFGEQELERINESSNFLNGRRQALL